MLSSRKMKEKKQPLMLTFKFNSRDAYTTEYVSRKTKANISLRRKMEQEEVVF